MGMILVTGDSLVGIEVRRESVILIDMTEPEKLLSERENKDRHVFAYDGDRVEVSKEWLAALLRFFDDPAKRALAGVASPPRTGAPT
jgi:hypothetical protein